MELYKIKRLFANILFPPKCICCGELLDIEENATKNIAVCPDCVIKYRMAKAEVCGECNLAVSKCLCGVSKRGVETGNMPKLFYYRADNESSVQSKIIYALKHKNDIRFAEFLADELAISVSELLGERKIDPTECIFTYVPRRNKALCEDGFDQGQRIASCLSAVFDCKRNFKRLFVRVGGQEQKKLDVNARKANIKNTVKLHRNAKNIVAGKVVLLVDDLVTSGTTMSVAKSLLVAAGAQDVICITVARTK